MKITINIAPETYLNILRAASDAIAYWGTVVTFTSAKRARNTVIQVAENDGSGADFDTLYTVDLEAIRRAFGLLAELATVDPHVALRLGRLLGGHVTQWDVDMLIQLACFGECRYG